MCPWSEAPKGITWASIVSFPLLWWLDDNKMTRDLSRGDTTQYFTAQWLEIGLFLIHRQLRHVHCSLKLQLMSHFVDSIALSGVLFESSIFPSWESRLHGPTADGAESGSLKQDFFTWIIHCPFCFYKSPRTWHSWRNF